MCQLLVFWDFDPELHLDLTSLAGTKAKAPATDARRTFLSLTQACISQFSPSTSSLLLFFSFKFNHAWCCLF